MNGKKAKLIRNEVYGTEFSHRKREYRETNIRRYKSEIKDPNEKENLVKKGFGIMKEAVKAAAGMFKEFFIWHTATLVADPERRRYQDRKKEYIGTPRNLRAKIKAKP